MRKVHSQAAAADRSTNAPNLTAIDLQRRLLPPIPTRPLARSAGKKGPTRRGLNEERDGESDVREVACEATYSRNMAARACGYTTRGGR